MHDSTYPYKEIDPEWTELEYSRGGARDDLGIETLSESILADLLPGINNQTRRARYYSFWAWVLHDFIKDPDTFHNQSNFYEWLRRREDALILAFLAHECEGGMAGTNIGSEVWDEGKQNAYPIGWKSLKTADGGAYEQYYRGAMLENNIIRRDDGDPHDNLTKSVGLPLANSYEKAVKGTQFVSKYLDANQLRRTDIEDFAQKGCLCLLNSNDIERRNLVDTLFRFDTADVYAVKRLATLSFFLDIIAQSEGLPLSQNDFRATLYFSSYGKSHAYKPEGNLLEPAQRWRAFQLRQYFVFAVESFWSLFLHRIETTSMSEWAYMSWLLQDMDLEMIEDEYGLYLKTFDASELSLEFFLHAVRDSLPPEALHHGPLAMNTPLNEHGLFLAIRSERSRTDVQTHAGKALLMMALIYWRCLPWKDDPGWQYLSDTYAAGRMPVESFIRHIDHAIQEGWSLSKWLRWFHCHYLWLQHRRITLEKLITRKQETAKFTLSYEEPDHIPHYQGLGLDTPKMNAPRFPSALAILTDLALIAPDGEGYRLLDEGKEILKKFRSYSKPEWKEELEIDETTFVREEANGG